MLSARELDQNKHLMIAKLDQPTNALYPLWPGHEPGQFLTPSGQPEFTAKDLPFHNGVAIEINEPRIYFGK